MKAHIVNFMKRGLVAAAGGPVIMAVIYWILGRCGVIESLHPYEVSQGILTVTLMAFIAAGISEVYQIEQIPLMGAIAIHASVLYLDYILIYLLNGWLKSNLFPILVFTGIFIVGYAAIWLAIWPSVRKQTQELNSKLKSSNHTN